MNPKQPKKMLIIDILTILRRYSDENHTLSQKDIMMHLERDFGMRVERKAIARNISDLIDEGYPIGYRTIERLMRDPKSGKDLPSNIVTDYYYEHEFTDAELRLLIDGLLFSRHIAPTHRRDLVRKLENLTSVHFKSHMKHVNAMSRDRTDNKQLFYTVALLDEAISHMRKVRFKYLSIGTDKQAHARRRSDGTERIYVCTPYQMAVNEGKYYLICNYEKYDDITNYRVDRILDLEILEERGRPFESLAESGGCRLDLTAYMREHIHMYAGGSMPVTFRITKRMTGDIIDIFGDGVRFFNESDDRVDVEARVNEEAMVRFARSNAPDVVVLSPQRLVERVSGQLQAAAQAYGRGAD